MRQSETNDLRHADRVHVSVPLDAQDGRHRGELTVRGAARPDGGPLLFSGPVERLW